MLPSQESIAAVLIVLDWWSPNIHDVHFVRFVDITVHPALGTLQQTLLDAPLPPVIIASLL